MDEIDRLMDNIENWATNIGNAMNDGKDHFMYDKKLEKAKDELKKFIATKDAEIARLEKLVAKNNLETAKHCLDMNDDNARLRTELDAMKGALERIYDISHDWRHIDDHEIISDGEDMCVPPEEVE